MEEGVERWERVAEGGRGWRRVGEGGGGWKRVEESESGWNKLLPHLKVIGTRALLALKW